MSIGQLGRWNISLNMALQNKALLWIVSVIGIQCCSLLQARVQASQKCSEYATSCEFVCSAIECEMYFQCSTRNKTSYTPTSQGLTYCCPGYFKTSTGSCQVCPDKKFMRYVNNCGYCLDCSDCDSTPNDTIKYPCNRTRNTVCHIENDITLSPGSVCPIVEVTSPEMTTIPSETETTGSDDPISPTPGGPQKSTGKSFRQEMIIFAFLFSVLTFFILCCCYLRYRAGRTLQQHMYVPVPKEEMNEMPDEQSSRNVVNSTGDQLDGDQIDSGEQNNKAVQTDNSSGGTYQTDPGQSCGNMLNHLAKKIFIVQNSGN